MPDMTHPDFPDQYRFLKATETFHLELPKKLRQYYDSFAEDESAPLPPEGALIPGINDPHRAKITNYAETVMSLERVFNELYESSKRLAPLAHDSLEKSAQGKQAINNVVVVINGAAGALPQDGTSEDDHILAYVTQALEEGDRVIKEAMMDQQGLSKEVDKESEALKELRDQLTQMQKENADLRQRLADPAGITPPSWTPPSTADPSYIDPSTFPTGLDSSDDTGFDGLTPSGNDSRLDDRTPGGVDNLGNTSGMTSPTTPAAPASAATSPVGSGMDILGPMMQMITQQAMMRNLADQDLNNRRAELDQRRFEDELAPEAAPPVAAPVMAQPATALPPTTAPAAHHAQPSSIAATSTSPAGAPARTPGADDKVLYTFPDGRTQKVSVLVAQALDAAFGDHSGTDAQKAYEKTSAKWSNTKQIGDHVDPFQLMTGDVATWAKRTAILVVFTADEGGTLEAVINGELKPFTAEMSDSTGEFGQFTGFAHPKGIELTASADEATPPATPGTSDQSGNPAMQVATAPAS
ncbi:TMF family protein [Nocardia amamiensis]|uniref:TMF family protein n=1 Tax=Nocardia amamiensis TaxID=404578 RepID=A0ABS0D2P8_9NOCA|nr:TMF family protein [Nocardia amamiensis]MBF6302921.1 TMF family protein [Nocardia amamiensis]